MSTFRGEQILGPKLDNNLCFGCTPFFSVLLLNNIDEQMIVAPSFLTPNGQFATVLQKKGQN